jgi:hypothetical protein
MFRNGQIRSTASVRGGRDNLSYFASGSFADEDGYMLSNGQKKTSLRTNLQLTAAKNFDVSADIGVIRSNLLQQPDGTSGTTGVFSMLLWARRSPRTRRRAGSWSARRRSTTTSTSARPTTARPRRSRSRTGR